MDEIAATDPEDSLLRVVADMLESDGYDAVQLREVARRAQTSLSTIYKRFPTRDDLIFAALHSWMARHRYAGLTTHPREDGVSLYKALMELFRSIFEPWERHPEMLTAYFRARSSPGGQKLFRHGFEIVEPAGRELLADVDAEFVGHLNTIISSVIYGLLGQFAAGEIAVSDILTTLDRTVFYLTLGYEATQPDFARHDATPLELG